MYMYKNTFNLLKISIIIINIINIIAAVILVTWLTERVLVEVSDGRVVQFIFK